MSMREPGAVNAAEHGEEGDDVVETLLVSGARGRKL